MILAIFRVYSTKEIITEQTTIHDIFEISSTILVNSSKQIASNSTGFLPYYILKKKNSHRIYCSQIFHFEKLTYNIILVELQHQYICA